MFLFLLNLFFYLYTIIFSIYFLLDILIVNKLYIVKSIYSRNLLPVVFSFYFVKNEYAAIQLSNRIKKNKKN